MKMDSCRVGELASSHGQKDPGLLKRYILMSLSPLIRKPLLGWSLVLAVPVLAWGQTSYTTNLLEYSISGPVPGDQVRPQAAVSSLGGFLVWDDNAIDGRGQGVGALALDSNFKAVGSPFRVNQIVAKDQTRAQLALLQGGGVVFVWQGGSIGRENIYARFLSASNTWLTGDVLLNSSVGEFHKNPAVAVQANGNVVVVWSSYHQQTSASMQDIYGQVLSPAGEKIGTEFLVNQFTPYNQRNPSVAAPKAGGFAVVWVSEQENALADTSASNYVSSVAGPSVASVDIYARVYGADGGPNGNNNTNEFQVNVGSNPCATPVVAAAADGSLLVAWAEKDMVVHTNGWDIKVRPVSSAGLLGPVSLANSYLIGDQYAPRIAANGGNAFLVWTSLGQDGSWEGVYGQFLQFDGTPVGSEIRLNTTTVGRQIQGTIVADGSARFLGLWACYSGGASGVDLFAQQYAAAGYTPGTTVTTVFAAPASDPFPEILDTTNPDPLTTTGGTTNLPSNGDLR